MKISFVEPHLKLYGGVRRIIELANRLTERGHNVTIFHSNGSPCEWTTCNAKIKSHQELLSEEHDVIIYNDPNITDYLLVKRAKAKLKVYYVLALYDKDLLKGIKPKILMLWKGRNRRLLIHKLSLQAPYLHLANATWMQAWLKENMAIDSTLLIGGVNRKVFYPLAIHKTSNEIRLLCSGDPREWKGTKTILEAVEIVKKTEPEVVLDTYHGQGIPQEEMARVYSAADIFLDGQWYAGWNNPVAEAMACKVPVVCTDIGGVKDFAFHEKTALLTPPHDPPGMAAAIIRLIKDEKLRKTLQENAYEHIKQFDWDKSAEKLEKILEFELTAADFNPSYIGLRKDIIKFIPSESKTILDIGCSTGILGRNLKCRNNRHVVGIELDEKMAEIASERLDQVIVGDIEKIKLEDHLPPNCFDCVIFADILEHLRDPWRVLKNSTQLIANRGVVIASIPNIQHYSTIFMLAFRGYWPYRERGIHDRTHLRFFTLKNIKEMFQDTDLEIIKVDRNYRFIESGGRFNIISKYLAIPPFRNLLTFQYLIVAQKRPGNPRP